MAVTTTPELRAQRLGSALRGLAAELVEERRKVAELRHQVAELEARLESLSADRRGADRASLSTSRPLSGWTSRLFPSSNSSRNAPIWCFESVIGCASTIQRTPSVNGGVVSEPM